MESEAQLAALHNTISTCARCPLYRCRTHAVPGAGTTRAPIMLVGEAPGHNEDKSGLPFVGKAGHKLDEWLAAADLKRTLLYVTNTLKCKPEDNRFPSDPSIVEACLPYLHEQIKLVQPLAIIVAGKMALHHLVLRGTSHRPDIDKFMGPLHRRLSLFGDTRIGVIYHPAYILRRWSPIDERRCIDVLKSVRDFVAARVVGDPAPSADLVDIAETEQPSYQQRLRLFGNQ